MCVPKDNLGSPSSPALPLCFMCNMCTSMYMQAHVCMHACGGYRSILGVCLYHIPLHVLRQGFHRTGSLLIQPASPRDPTISAYWDYGLIYLFIYMSSGGWNLIWSSCLKEKYSVLLSPVSLPLRTHHPGGVEAQPRPLRSSLCIKTEEKIFPNKTLLFVSITFYLFLFSV